MGGAARRPANSGIGATVPNRSNIFYQKLLNRTSSGGGKEKGLKGKRNCRRLRILLVPLSARGGQAAGLALHRISSGLAPLGLRLPEKFSPVLFLSFSLLHLFFTVVFDTLNKK